MCYDLEFLNEYCQEIGLIARMAASSALEVRLGKGAVLCFLNAEQDKDCQMGFLGTPWHTHGNLMFVDPRGYYIELDPLNLLSGLKSGTVLVCEQHEGEMLVDRWLIHSEYNDEFRHLGPREWIVVRRAHAPDADMEH